MPHCKLTTRNSDDEEALDTEDLVEPEDALPEITLADFAPPASRRRQGRAGRS